MNNHITSSSQELSTQWSIAPLSPATNNTIYLPVVAEKVINWNITSRTSSKNLKSKFVLGRLERCARHSGYDFRASHFVNNFLFVMARWHSLSIHYELCEYLARITWYRKYFTEKQTCSSVRAWSLSARCKRGNAPPKYPLLMPRHATTSVTIGNANNQCRELMESPWNRLTGLEIYDG